MNSKITDLEIRLTHQEAAIEEINDVLYKQHETIEALKTDLAILQRQLREIGSGNIVEASQEPPPPHY